MKYHQLGLGSEPVHKEPAPPVGITVKDLANRFLVPNLTSMSVSTHAKTGNSPVYLPEARQITDPSLRERKTDPCTTAIPS